MATQKAVILGLLLWMWAGAVVAEDSKGIRRELFRDREGQEVGWYEGSYALLIGVSDYTASWPDLESVPSELATVGETLQAHGFQVDEAPANPTARQIEDAVRDFIAAYGYNEHNRLLVFFSGHGYSFSGDDRGFLVPSDAPDPRRDRTGFLRKALPMSDVLAWARKIIASHALFLFDSCFSGTVLKAKSLPELPVHISSVTAKPVRQFISAGGAGETVPAKSVFTPHFNRALRGAADLDDDGYVTGTELGMYLHRSVLSYRQGQTPQYGKIRDPDLDEGDFVFRLPQHASPESAAAELELAKLASLPVTVNVASSALLRRAVNLYLGHGDARVNQLEAGRLFEKAAETGEPMALMWLARSLYQGRAGLAKDEKRARELASKALPEVRRRAQAKDLEGAFLLADAHYFGLGAEQDLALAATLNGQACEGGYTVGCVNLGLMYDHGEGVPADDVKAVSLYRRACGGDLLAGCVNLGRMYASGSGVPEDDAKAVALYRRTCDRGFSMGCVSLGQMYSSGSGVSEDDVKAVALYSQACDALDGWCVFLGNMYEEGAGVREDDAKAAALYRQACDGGSLVACLYLGRMYKEGSGVERDSVKAEALLRQCCDAGVTWGCSFLGDMYRNGSGVTRDAAKAVALYRQSCDAGSAGGCVKLGVMHASGEGVPEDDSKAMALYRLGCDGGDAQGCANMGFKYADGSGVPQDDTEAVAFFRKACDGGHKGACKRLRRKCRKSHLPDLPACQGLSTD